MTLNRLDPQLSCRHPPSCSTWLLGPWGSSHPAFRSWGFLAAGSSASSALSPQTAQLQLAKQNAQDQPGVEAHQQEVRELKHK